MTYAQLFASWITPEALNAFALEEGARRMAARYPNLNCRCVLIKMPSGDVPKWKPQKDRRPRH